MKEAVYSVYYFLGDTGDKEPSPDMLTLAVSAQLADGNQGWNATAPESCC